MRHLLCILCIFCMLLGAALPTAAEGETQFTIPAEELGNLAKTPEEVLTYLNSKGYTGGALTITLPSGSIGDVICNAQLPGGATLTLQGAGTTVTGLTIANPKTVVSGITFDGETGMTLTADGGFCMVSSCTFNSTKQAFCFDVSNSSNVPRLELAGNTFQNRKVLVKENGAEVGTWSFTPKGTGAATLGFGVQVKANTETTEITFTGDTVSAAENGWSFQFSTSCNYSSAYYLYGGTLYIGTSFPTSLNLDKTAATLSLSNPQPGVYTCVSGSAPAVEETDGSTRTIVISADQNAYIGSVEMKAPFKAVSINNGRVYSLLDSKGILRFPVDASGTYSIKEVKLPQDKTTKVETRLYTISTKDVFPIFHVNFMYTLRRTEDGNVQINCTDAGRRPISIPVESLEAACAENMTVTLNAKSFSLLLDTAAMKSLAQQAKGDRVVLQYRSLNHKTLSSVGLSSVNSHLARYPGHVADLAFLVSATSDDEPIEDLQMGTVTLTIPFLVLPGTEEYPSECYALTTEADSTARKTEVKDGYLTTVLTDLTEHMVFLAKPEPVPETTEATEPETEATEAPTEAPTTEPTLPTEPAPPRESRDFPLWLPILIVVLASGNVAAWFLFFQKRPKR